MAWAAEAWREPAASRTGGSRGGTHLTGRLRVISERGRDAQFKQLVADLLLELAEVQLKLDDLMNENAALRGQLQTRGNPRASVARDASSSVGA
jgi:hypothetical protein